MKQLASMNAVLAMMITLAGLNSFAARIDADATTTVRACSSYLMADAEIHNASAAANFRQKVASFCISQGYNEWQVYNVKTTPGIGIPVYCIKAQIVCQ